MKVRNMALCGLFAALFAVCGWIAVPFGDIAFTLQTFAVFLCLGLMGGKWGCVSNFVYLLMGAVGLPVFTGFQGGFGILFGATGGYLLGFLAAGLVYWGITAAYPKASLLGMGAGLVACYAIGTLWFWGVYLGGSAMGFWAAAVKCVAPYVLPDGVKLILAYLLTRRLQKYV